MRESPTMKPWTRSLASQSRIPHYSYLSNLKRVDLMYSKYDTQSLIWSPSTDRVV